MFQGANLPDKVSSIKGGDETLMMFNQQQKMNAVGAVSDSFIVVEPAAAWCIHNEMSHPLVPSPAFS